MTTEKLDLYKLHKAEYATPKTPKLIEVQPASYLTIVGRGKPAGEQFTMKLGHLYNVAYSVKMASKRQGKDYKVCKLEGLWWGPEGEYDFFDQPTDSWNWKLIIRTPDHVERGEVVMAIENLLGSGKDPGVQDVNLETIGEGLCVQMLHLGSYSQEDGTLSEMKKLAQEEGLSFHGLHHEIYLSDPKRVPEDRLRTILRMPVQ